MYIYMLIQEVLILSELHSENIFGSCLGFNWVDVSLRQGLVDSVMEMCCQLCVASFPYRLQSWLKFHTGRSGRDPQGHVPARPGLNTYSARSSRCSTGNNGRSLVIAIVHQERCMPQEKYGLPCADFYETHQRSTPNVQSGFIECQPKFRSKCREFWWKFIYAR
jgi:hypothetical protein